LRYANDGGDGDGDGIVEGGYAPYESWVRSSSPSKRRTLFASESEGASSDTDFESFLSIDESPSNAADALEDGRPPRVRSKRICGGKRARMARFANSRFSRPSSSRRHRRSNHHHHPGAAHSSVSPSGKPPPAATAPPPDEYQKRKAAWAAKYTSVATLRSAFGTNKNRLWGDFGPDATRRLYHALLPRALLGLRDMGLSDADELAPLAYQARVAAKKYARERSMLPGRIGSMLYDGFRQWRRYGKFDHRGMTWEQVWRKYEDQVLREAVEEMAEGDGADDAVALGRVRSAEKALLEYADALDDEELTTRICLRILERSVVTNEAIDKLFLKRIMNEAEEDDDDIDDEDDDDEASVIGDITTRRQRKQMRRQRRKLRIQADLKAIEKKFDDDIRELLLHGTAGANGNGGDDNSRREDDQAKASKNGRRKRRFFFSRKSRRDRLFEEGDPPRADAGESTAFFARGGAGTSTFSLRDRDAIDTLEDSSSDVAAVILSMSDFEYHRAKDFSADPTAVDRGDVASASYARDSFSVAPAADADATSGNIGNKKKETRRLRKLAVHEVFALRILASTKQRIASLHLLSNGSQDSPKEYGKVVAIDNDEDDDGAGDDRQ